jgi:hypothetical protein
MKEKIAPFGGFNLATCLVISNKLSSVTVRSIIGNMKALLDNRLGSHPIETDVNQQFGELLGL